MVTGVDGEPLEGSTIDDSITLIRGPRGSEVALTVDREGQELEIPITRDTVVADDVRSATLADGRIGYISIDNFSGNAAEDFEADLQAHLDAGLEKLIVDVRDDPGGFVDATVEISSQFIEEGAVFWEEDADGTQVAIDVTGEGIATDPRLELVLLVNGGSASASEILGGALQDAGRAQLVGEPTFGKGTVQEWSELPGENGGYRLSIAKWLTRDKTWIHGEGLITRRDRAPGGRALLGRRQRGRSQPRRAGRGRRGPLARPAAADPRGHAGDDVRRLVRQLALARRASTGLTGRVLFPRTKGGGV